MSALSERERRVLALLKPRLNKWGWQCTWCEGYIKDHDLEADDGYCIMRSDTVDGGKVFNKELRKQIIMTAWPMVDQ